MSRNTTARMYTVEEMREAVERLVRMGMEHQRAVQVVAEAYPEHRESLSN